MPRRPRKNPKIGPPKGAPTPNRRDQILADFATLRVPVTAEQLDEGDELADLYSQVMERPAKRAKHRRAALPSANGNGVGPKM